MKLAIITPSYIRTSERIQFARKSLQSLQECTEVSYPHIIVDDIPRFRRRFIRYLPDIRALHYAPSLYRGDNIHFTRRFKQGSASAMRDALKIARNMQQDAVFIHMDDNVYIPELSNLIQYACDALDKHNDLQIVRLTGIPILSNNCTPELGNRTSLHIESDTIRFESVVWHPHRYDDYTLWKAPFNANSMDGDYWAIPLWSTIYRLDFLERLLTLTERVQQARHLSTVEWYYRDNWSDIYSQIPGYFGHINMQFCGLEMQNNKNWAELIRYPNKAIR